MQAQPGTDDMGPEDLTGHQTSGWNGSLERYVHPYDRPGYTQHKQTPAQREAIARARARLLAKSGGVR
jgi:hypothetical protein